MTPARGAAGSRFDADPRHAERPSRGRDSPAPQGRIDGPWRRARAPRRRPPPALRGA